MEAPDRVGVLIVGAGPTGLMLALQLARRGVRAAIIDRNAGPSVRTKALGVQARTLEIYSQLGIADAAVELGRRADGASMWVDRRRVARVPLGDIGRGLSPFPFLLILGQDDNERLLGQSLRGLGIGIRWSTELVALRQHNDHARATLRLADGSTGLVRADWVAGCDGARSAVRHLNAIDFPGAPYEHVFFVADTTAAGPMTPGELNVFLGRRGFHLFFPMRGADHWRVVGIVPPHLRGRDDLAFDEVAPFVAQHVGVELRFRACAWFSTYRIHHRRAARFRVRRCFLLGDAAHIHSPVGAQGMNTGLQDAHNLAWKLALVVSGRADDPLLDTYAAEREPIADRLLRTTDQAFSLVVSEGRVANSLRTRVLPRTLALAMHCRAARTLAFRTISQIGIRYPHSPLSMTLPDAPPRPRAGDRFPWFRVVLTPGGPEEDLFRRLDDRRFTLMLIGRQAPPGVADRWTDLLSVVSVPDMPVNRDALARAGIAMPSFVLLRPDGHVGFAGTVLRPDDVDAYFTQRVGARPHRPG